MIDEQKLARFRVHYYDDRASDVVVCGNAEFVMAERHHGIEAIKQGGLDATNRIVYYGARRSKLLEPDTSFQKFVEGVALIEEIEDEEGRPESPAPLET